jgi:hypothetical protein
MVGLDKRFHWFGKMLAWMKRLFGYGATSQ